MKQITFREVRSRLRNLQNLPSSDLIITESFNTVAHAKRLLETSANLSISSCLDLFEVIVEKDSVSDIRKMGHYIAENNITKVRNSAQTNTLLRHRLGRIKSKLNPKLDMKDGLPPSPIEQINSPVSGGYSVPSSTSTGNNIGFTDKEDAVNEAYNEMIEKCTRMVACDRIIKNYNEISRRFNLEKMFESGYDIYGTVVELCDRVDTYEMPQYVKYNVIIETAWYGFESHNISYSSSEIVKAATDYFNFHGYDDSQIGSIIENSLFFDISELISETADDYTPSTSRLAQIELTDTAINESESFQDIFKKFKQEESQDHPEKKLNKLISKLYSKNIDGVINGTADLLKWIRTFFILSTSFIPFIGPIIACVGLIADKFLSIYSDRRELGKMTECLDKEINTCREKLKEITDSNQKDALRKYISSLENARNKIDMKHSEILDDDEFEAKLTKRIENEVSDPDDPDFGFDFDFDSFLDESSIKLSELIGLMEQVTATVKNNPNRHAVIESMTDKLNYDDLIEISKIESRIPDSDRLFESSMDSVLNNIKLHNIVFEYAYDRSIRMATINQARDLYRTSHIDTVGYMSLDEACSYLEGIQTYYEALNILKDAYSQEVTPITEGSFKNTLRVASLKLKQAMTKMSDKAKASAKGIDVAMNNLTKSVERAFTNDNRESVIKGSILPSAHKILGLALAAAGLWAVHLPVLAVSLVLGYVGVSKHFKAKERQDVADEIEIELKMCNEYIEQAKAKNDMKALKELLMIQRTLTRQHQRIVYNMSAHHGQRYYKAYNVGED